MPTERKCHLEWPFVGKVYTIFSKTRTNLVWRCLVIVGTFASITCHNPRARRVETPVAASDPQEPTRIAELNEFDRIVTNAFVFIDPHERSLFTAIPPSDVKGVRLYLFSLKQQDLMTANRHFYLITVAVSRLSQGPDAGPELIGTGGPNGGFIEARSTTSDRSFQVQVTAGMLLPDAVRVPNIDPESLATRVVHAYDTSH